MAKICQKCGAEFKTAKIIDGKTRNFSHRKLCLECSPFNSKNTRPNGVLKPEEKIGHQKWLKRNRSKSVTKWRRRTKLKLILYKGGKCQKCGYNKSCLGAYDFHHRDPSNKKFHINTRNIKSWARLIEEVDKCDLLCRNCHAETHYGFLEHDMSISV